MTIRPFIPWPDRRLKTVCAPVAEVTDEIRAIWRDMIDTMRTMPGGVGLAAPQIGVMVRLAVVDASEGREVPIRLANPELISASEALNHHEEASPNLPGLSATVARPAQVTLRYVDETGHETERQFDGLWATSVQHQLDHLDGRIYLDRLSRTRRQMLLKRYQKLRKG
ncbi:MAG: peptide deformylase [Pseudomonadota bacterium]